VLSALTASDFENHGAVPHAMKWMRAFGANRRSPFDHPRNREKDCKASDFLLNLSSGMQTVIPVIATGTGSLRERS
jgi:hypothetical protein